MRSDRRRGDGFTLVEVLVALAIGGLVVLMAHRAFGAATDFALALGRGQTAHDEVMETRRYLATLLGSVDAAAEGSAGFRGGEGRIVFGAWHDGALQGMELTVREGRLVATTQTDTVRLMRSTGFAAEYLLEPGANARWMKGWQSPVSAPLAVRLRIARGDSSGVVDTLLLAIGPRG